MSAAPPASGQGPLFSSPDCEAARAAFRARPRGLVDKRMTVPEAVTRFVADGDYLGSGGFGGDRIATAALHEVVRQKKQDLGLAGHTAAHDFQSLCAGNLAGRGKLVAQRESAAVVGADRGG